MPHLTRLALVAVVFASLLVLTALLASAQDDARPLYRDPTAPIEDRVNDLLARMTLEEKIAQLGGDQSAMATPDNERLGIPGFKMGDGPNGVRWGNSTCFPSLSALAATWDPALVERTAAAMGREFRAKGRYVALGPCINLVRDPRGGRSFETMGEDPFLLARLTAAYVRGMQSQRVIATAKHFACNNQENGRGSADVQVPERSLREMYLPAFRAAVQEGGAWAIMSAYNLVRGEHCTQNRYLQVDILKKEWGFPGIVMSDWGACHATVEAINGGLDVEMPHANFFGQPLLDAVKDGRVPEETLDEAVRRCLRAKFWAGIFEQPVEPDESAVNTPETQALVRDVARRAIVLLKNERDLLPLDPAALKSIAIIGPNAAEPRHCGGGSSYISPPYSVTVLDGIKNRVGDGVQVTFVQGCQLRPLDSLDPLHPTLLEPPDAAPGQHGLLGEYFNNPGLEGEPVLTRVDPEINFDWGGGSPGPGVNNDLFSVRWRGILTPRVTGNYVLGCASDDGFRLYLDGKRVIDDWRDHGVETKAAGFDLEAGRTYEIVIEFYENRGEAVCRLGGVVPGEDRDPFREAREAAAAADVAIVAVGTSARIESEGHDRPSLKLVGEQDDLIREVWRTNRRTVVLSLSGSAVLMEPWIEYVPAALQCWFPGQEAGNAIADILFGDYNPGGKLALTFPRSDEQLPPFDSNYETPAESRGYRYYEAQGLEPRFPFGYGLSYTRFTYGGLRVTPEVLTGEALAAGEQVRVSVDVENVGRRAGDEIVQLYVGDVQSRLPRPPKELKGFQRVTLQPGEKKTVMISLGPDALSYYDPDAAEWVAEPGEFEILVGASSRDIKARATFTLR